ncbi:hypothetical protein HJC23_006292 [Cyclotella cryptica]|uniref:Uncharacterized protein n=1 Tax=Cyclotella cryptica TaxID=29204 RepID=A0ABD3P1J4_9STRA|eukprot:CCRYP_018136-RA/>CCRYP_018136-RA protein AED:0.01 eAED:0.01 QI:428/1/1/1/0/0/2/963/730
MANLSFLHQEEEAASAARSNGLEVMSIAGLSAPPYNNQYKGEEPQAPNHRSLESIHSNHRSPTTSYDNTATLAVVRIRAWDPANPQFSHHFTCSSAVLFDDGMLALGETGGRKIMLQTSRRPPLSHITEVDDEDGSADDDKNDDASLKRGESERDNFQTTRQIEEGENDVCAGSLVGITLEVNSSFPTFKNKQISWNIDDTIFLRKRLHLLPYNDMNHLVHLMEYNHPSLQTLIMDGLPPSIFTKVEAQLFADALGEKNTSIQYISMRYSNIDDDIAMIFALALVENSTLKRFSLEGNRLTNVAAKNFFTVIRQSNKTLEQLDMSNNPSIDADILDAVDQFMQQRELRRSLLNGPRRGSRTERRRSDPFVREGESGLHSQFESGVVICHESIIDGTFDPNVVSLDISPEPPELSASMAPLPTESFFQYMQRMNAATNTNIRFVPRNILSEGDNGTPNPPSLHQIRQPTFKTLANSVLASQRLYAERSGQLQRHSLRVMPTQQLQNTGDQFYQSRSAGNLHVSSRMAETNAPMHSQRSLDQGNQLDSLLSSRESSFTTLSSAQSRAQSAPSRQYLEKSFSHKTSGSSSEKARGPRELSNSVGAYHVNEPAPSRQNRAGGLSRSRPRMTQSQRMARIKALTNGVGNSSINDAYSGSSMNALNIHSSMNGSSRNDTYNDNDVRGTESEQGTRPRMTKSMLGLDDVETRLDCFVCVLIIVLVIALVVMIILYAV